MIREKKVTDVYDMQVYTDEGTYFGVVEEAQLRDNKVSGWRIKATKNSFLSRVIGGAKGVIVPHHFVKAMSDIMVISKQAVPSYEEKEENLDE